jgi:hypothetical protein
VLDIQQRLWLAGGYGSQIVLGIGKCSYCHQLWRLICIDGGGATTCSSLIIIRRICEAVDVQEKLLDGSSQQSHGYTPNAHLPSLYFDNCVGSDTGA